MRKRRSNGTWFPLLPTNRIIDENTFSNTIRRIVLQTTTAGSGEPINGVIPITYDEPQESPNLNPDAEGLSEIIGNEYIIKRILGSCFVSRSRLVETEDPFAPLDYPGVAATAGFFVARAGPEQAPDTDNVPIGWNTTAVEDFSNYSPQAAQAIREPWMWRRTWILGQGDTGNGESGSSGTAIVRSIYRSYPPNNAMYPSGMTGPQVDVKSRRHVRQDERLWFAASVWPLVIDTANIEVSTSVQFDLDIRLFGQLVKARARGSF